MCKKMSNSPSAKAHREKMKNPAKRREFNRQVREYARTYQGPRLFQDPVFRAYREIRLDLWHVAVRLSKGMPLDTLITRYNGRYAQYTGFDILEVIESIEKSFKPEMSWANYGTTWKIEAEYGKVKGQSIQDIVNRFHPKKIKACKL